jgi:hypothetical protein
VKLSVRFGMNPDAPAGMVIVPSGVTVVPVAVNVSVRSTVDAVSTQTDEVLFGVSGELDPMTIRPAGENAAEFVNCTMPMRI